MQLTNSQTLIIIFSIAFGAIITRFTPFLLFPEKKQLPQIIIYLGQVLPAAMMGLLVIYCLKNVSIIKAPYGIPEAISILIIILLHKWKNNVLLSISGATAIYMILIQYVFI